MTFTPPTKATAFVWRAEPTEPGVTGARYEATNSQSAPAPIKPVAAIDGGLVHAESVFGAWELYGTAHATAHRDAYGEPLLQLWIPVCYGVTVGVDEAVRNGWVERSRT